MLGELLEWWQRNFLFGLFCIGLGVLVMAPLLLVPSWRRWLLRFDVDIEGIGLVALLVLLLAVGCYNYFRRGNGA